MTGLDSLSSATAGLSSVGLAALNDSAPLQTRKDRKYLVPMSSLPQLLEQMSDDLIVLEIDGRRAFHYESVYFDTPDHVSYMAAALRRRRRFKVRTRTYLDSGLCLLEVKTREGRGLTIKHRIPYDSDHRDRLDDTGLDFIDGFESIAAISGELRPALTTRYQRTTFLETTSHSRITVDVGLECIAPDGSRVSLASTAVVETKTAGRPCEFDHLLWGVGHRPVNVSKFATGMAALNPSLKANKWNRILRHHFDRAPRPAVDHRSRRSVSPSIDTTDFTLQTDTRIRGRTHFSGGLLRPPV